MLVMASLSKQSSAGKPKLERRNARKISDYEPSDSPRAPSSFKTPLDKSKSFRVTGLDSEGEIEKICEELGIPGGADAFSIPRDAWEAGKAKSGSLDRFILDHKPRSRSFEYPPGSFLSRPGADEELASSPLPSTSSLGPSPFYNSMSSSSGGSFASDGSLATDEKGFLGSLDPPRDLVPASSAVQLCNDHQQPGISNRNLRGYGMHETRHFKEHKQIGNASRNLLIREAQRQDDPQALMHSMFTERRHLADPKQTGSVAHEPPIRKAHHQDNPQAPMHTTSTQTLHLADRKQIGSVAHELPICETRHQDDPQARMHPMFTQAQHLADCKQSGSIAHKPSIPETQCYRNLQPGNDMERFPRVVEQATSRQLLQPWPGNHLKPNLQSLSTQELVAGFGPDEGENINRVSDSDDSEDDEVDVTEDKAGEGLDFVLEVVQQYGALDKEQTHGEDTMTSGPLTPTDSFDNFTIHSWRKLEMLGSGSFGTVYEGMSQDGVYFAVKEVSLSGNDSKAQQCVIQLEQEINFLSKFRHENIVRYLGTQKEPDKLYIFLELVTKGSLSSLYQKYTLFDSQIRSYTRQILSGLKYLHERKVMHRDIKCANILVDISGKIKVADFGLAKQISQLDELKSCKGSAYWMAPEVIDPRKTYSFPADIWSLGCTVLEMQTRRPPFGDMEWHRVLWKVGHGEAPPIPETLSEDAKDFIRQCLEVNPARRPSARQLLEHPFVQGVGGTGLTPRNSFTQDTSELATIAEEKTFDS